MRRNVYAAIVKQEVTFFDKNRTGELVNRLSADTSLVSQCVTSNISDGIRSTALVVAGIGMMVSKSVSRVFHSLILILSSTCLRN